jgi:ABC-2 type transport system permease protein
MMRWIEVFRYETRLQLRRKSYLFLTFGIPLLALAAFFGYQFYQDQTQSKSDEPKSSSASENQDLDKIGYVDLTPEHLFPAPDTYGEVKCPISDDEWSMIKEASGPNLARSEAVKRTSSPYCLDGIVLPYTSFAAGKQALDDKVFDVLYVIQPDYLESGEIWVYMKGFNITQAGTQTTMDDFVLRSLLYNADAADFETLYARLKDPAFVAMNKITDTGAAQQDNENQNFLLVYGFGLAMMFSIFWGGGYLMQSVVQEKESRIIEIVLSSVPPTPLLLGKILAMGLLSLVQVGMLLGTFLFIISRGDKISDQIGNISVSNETLVLAFVYFLLGFLLFGSLMAAIGALSSTVRDSQNFVVVVTLPAAIPFFFLSIFAQEPNQMLAVVLSIFPITAPLSMIMRLAVADVPTGELLISLVVLVTSVIGAIWLAARLFRVNTLLMGSTPKIKDLPKLLRG